jgi:hypothetical protein
LFAIHTKRAALENVKHALLEINVHSPKSEYLSSTKLAPSGELNDDSEMLWHRPGQKFDLVDGRNRSLCRMFGAGTFHLARRSGDTAVGNGGSHYGRQQSIRLRCRGGMILRDVGVPGTDIRGTKSSQC